MKIYKLPAIALLGILLLLPALLQAQVLIPKNSVWKYDDNGNNLGTAWRAPAYNDAGWPSGPGILGFGDGQATGLDWGETTYYFRKQFTIANAAAVTALSLELLRDDGAVVYINGHEVVRSNMPSGNITSSTNADNLVSGSEETTYFYYQICNNNLLVNGTNTIAVEVHQDNFLSSDISFDLRLTDLSSTVPNIVRGPYLQTGTPSSVRVLWRTQIPTAGVLVYGTSETALNDTIRINGNCITNHEVLINNLIPNTTYHYRILHNEVQLPGQADQYFTTSPNPGTRQPVRAWLLGDAGTADNNQRNVRDAYYNYVNGLPTGQNQTDMVILLGDNAYDDGTDADYQVAVFENMYEAMIKKAVLWSTLGNHDGHSADAATQTGPYFDIFSFPKNGEAGGIPSGTEAYYSFDYANIHFIVLESNETDRSVGGAMYNWAQADIQNAISDWIVAIWHHPPYTRGSHLSDLETQLVEMRQNFLPMLESNGVDLVLSGHSHSYERSYFLNGHYGLSLGFNANNHTVGITGDGNGKINGDGAYRKVTAGPDAGKGAVYITAGSSGKTSGGLLNHPAMVTSLNRLGSCVLEVNNDTLHVKFLRETGAVDDYFTIIKAGLTAPSITLTNTPANTTVSCTADTTPTALGTLAASSTCTTPGVRVFHTDSIVSGNCAGNYTILRQWVAMDSCLNQTPYTQTITVVDTTAPTIACAQNTDTLLLDASGNATLPDYTSTITATDACGGNATITQSPAAGTTMSTTGNTVVNLIATDDCGNTESCQVNVWVTNSTITIGNQPADTAVYCGSDIDTSFMGNLTASSNCPSGGVTVSYQDASTGGACATISRTWTITDGCGTTLNYVQTIQYTDTVAPVLNCALLADTLYLSATDSIAVPNYLTFTTVTDDCDTSTTLTQQPAFGTTYTDTGSYQIQLTATDACGNTVSCNITVLVIDTFTTGIVALEGLLDRITLYPNPTENIITISKPTTEPVTMKLLSTNGKELLTMVLSEQETQIDLSAYPKGMYLVQLQNEKATKVIKVVRE